MFVYNFHPFLIKESNILNMFWLVLLFVISSLSINEKETYQRMVDEYLQRDPHIVKRQVDSVVVHKTHKIPLNAIELPTNGQSALGSLLFSETVYFEVTIPDMTFLKIIAHGEGGGNILLTIWGDKDPSELENKDLWDSAIWLSLSFRRNREMGLYDKKSDWYP